MNKTNQQDKLMWDYTPTKEQMKKVGWCLNHGIKISPLAIAGQVGYYYLDVDIRGNRKTSQERYRYDVIVPKMYTSYYWYYDTYFECVKWWTELSIDDKKSLEKPSSFKSLLKLYKEKNGN